MVKIELDIEHPQEDGKPRSFKANIELPFRINIGDVLSGTSLRFITKSINHLPEAILYPPDELTDSEDSYLDCGSFVATDVDISLSKDDNYDQLVWLKKV